MERVILTASDGMVYTDGVSGGKVVYLAEGKTADGWYEVSEQAYLQMAEQADAEDYEAALAKLGVAL